MNSLINFTHNADPVSDFDAEDTVHNILKQIGQHAQVNKGVYIQVFEPLPRLKLVGFACCPVS